MGVRGGRWKGKGGVGTSEGDVEKDAVVVVVVVSFSVDVDEERMGLTGDCPRRGGRWVPFLLINSSDGLWKVILLDARRKVFLVV